MIMFILVLFFAIVLVYLLVKLVGAMVEYISDAWRSKEKDGVADIVSSVVVFIMLAAVILLWMCVAFGSFAFQE